MSQATLSFPVLSTKENAPLAPSVSAPPAKKVSVAAGKGRKRTITTVNGDEVDLTAPVVASPIVVEAMRLRIIQLEDELAKAKADSDERPAKRAKTTTTASESASAGPSTGMSAKAEEKKRKQQLKKMFDRLKKDCKSDTCKFQGGPKTIRFDEVLEPSEFEGLFGGKGTLIQPTPQNKPKSTVTIINFTNMAQIQALFGDELKPLKGNVWSRGGMPARTGGYFGFGGSSTFTKSVKQGACDVNIRSLEVNYSKNSMKCSLKFEVAQVGGGGCYGLGYDSDDY